ncbi:MAG TPA: TonB-dependent receptor plug domain-containing protein, partial [Gemmatimonadales bacterium]|nr:TonB-dependent receptor plug domain-containing protein [Gemmatimonadales bacterium]
MTSCRRWCRTPLLSLALLVAPILLPAQEPAPAAGQATPAPAAAVLRGRVADLAGRPLAGAEVIARVATGRVAARAVTAEDGRFGLALAAADTGTVTVRAQRIGYRPAERTVRPGDTGAETLALDFALASAPVRLDEVVVTATRSATAVSELPAAVSVIDREEIAAQSAVGVGVGDMLGKTVPGLGAGAQSMSTYGQSLRGRSVTVLVDGVPLSTVRNVSRDLASIDPSVVERIEVVRGASAVYGDGATGGVINV